MAKKRDKKKTKKRTRSLVIGRLENVSKELFRRHYRLITDLVGSSPGVYALYDGNELYYVGKSTDLRKRVRRHLRDRHIASWTHFSLYLVRRAAHISEIESLLVRIANPKGNRAVPRGTAGSALRQKLRSMVKQKQREELDEMLPGTARRAERAGKRPAKHRKLQGLVSRSTPLYKTYKGKEYRATLTSSGVIKIGEKRFTTPSGAAKAIVRRPTVNGWRFWYIKDLDGDWVRLSEYKR